jgi:hypothetical protein
MMENRRNQSISQSSDLRSSLNGWVAAVFRHNPAVRSCFRSSELAKDGQPCLRSPPRFGSVLISLAAPLGLEIPAGGEKEAILVLIGALCIPDDSRPFVF